MLIALALFNKIIARITACYFNSQQQEKPTNCGTKAADVRANFLNGKLLCESTEYFGAFTTTVSSQRLSLQSVAPSATVWP